ncbi:hypothetical protein CGCVW01_v014097 [Colletotrichum viniferum]|nr:hypothetical protein CGCVW01_v014097 [Colletotrichum viniferum]
MPRKTNTTKKRPAPYRAPRTRSSTANSKSASVLDVASVQASESTVAASGSTFVALSDASLTDDISLGPVAPSAFPIFRLPRELRDLIYEYADILPFGTHCEVRVLKGEFILYTRKRHGVEACVPFGHGLRKPSLLLVCSQMREEVLHLFFLRTCFQFNSGKTSKSHGKFVESAWFHFAKLGSRTRGPDIQPPRPIQSMWKDLLSRLRHISIDFCPDSVMKPEWFSSAMKYASQLSVITIGLSPYLIGPPFSGYCANFCAEFNKIESLQIVRLGRGFKKEDVKAISTRVKCSVQWVCFCDRRDDKGICLSYVRPEVSLPRADSIRQTSVLLGCYFTPKYKNLWPPEWHVPGESFTCRHVMQSHRRRFDEGVRQSTFFCRQA